MTLSAMAVEYEGYAYLLVTAHTKGILQLQALHKRQQL